MINFFLKAKHWQIFLLTAALPFILWFYMMSTMFSGISEMTPGQEPDPEVVFENVFSIMRIIPFIVLPTILVHFTWMWSVGIGLQQKIPDGLKMKTGTFKIFLITPVLYMCFVFFFIFNLMLNTISTAIDHQHVDLSFLSWIGLLVPLHLFSMFCIFYCMHFAAKAIKLGERQRKVKFEDFIGEFFLIWFYPIGIWFCNP